MLLEQVISVDPSSPELEALVGRVAPDEDAARRLLARVLLHLPRIADRRGRLLSSAAEEEIERLDREEWETPTWMEPPRHVPLGPSHLALVEFDPERAKVVHERFHYLRSHRQGRHLAGMVDGRLALLFTFSTLDLDGVRERLPAMIGGSGLILSRVYATAWAPRNSLSWGLGQAVRALRGSRPRPRAIFTYLNPNIGFDGASYKAANWRFFGLEHGTRYAYFAGDYITDRELTARFGTSETSYLTDLLADRIEFSSMPLRPLQMYAYPLDHRARRSLAEPLPREWQRPWA